MKNITDYISEAQKKQGIPSRNKLAETIGIAEPSLWAIANNKTLPAEETILKLAELAEIPAEEALLDLSIWKAKSPEAKSVWEKIRAVMINLCLALTILTSFIGSGSLAASGDNKK